VKEESHPTTSGRSASTEQGSATRRPLAVDPAILRRSREIGEAIWIGLWAYDRATRQCECRDGTLVGLVLGGMAIADKKIAAELGRSVKWVRRWRAHAVNAGLLRAKRFPYGNLLAVVLPGKKFAKHEVREAPKWAQSRTRRKAKNAPKFVSSRVPTSGLSGVPKRALQSAQNGLPERTKLGTRRKTYTKTVPEGLAQVTLPPPSPPQGECCIVAKNCADAPFTAFGFLKQAQSLTDVQEAWRDLGMEVPTIQTAMNAAWENWWRGHQGEPVAERAAGFLEWIQHHGLEALAGVRFLAALKTKAREVARIQ